MPDRKTIFVSYCSEDEDLTPRVFTHLEGLDQYFPVDIWKDANRIRAGDAWRPEIEAAVAAADLAVLLVSPSFLASTFIKQHEMPRLRERNSRDGLRLIPIFLKPGAWPDWLSDTERRPRGKQALSEILEYRPSQVDRLLGEVVLEIAKTILKPEAARAAGGAAAPAETPDDACVNLIAETLLDDMPKDEAEATARELVGEISEITKLSGDGLFGAVRFFIEYHLLASEEPDAPLTLESSLLARHGDLVRPVVDRLKQVAKDGDFGAVLVEVNSHFFRRTGEREELWKAYFGAVVRNGALPRDAVISLSRVRVRLGYVAPQYLIAGLLSRFNEDWRPLLNAYQRSIPSPKQRRGAFESLQASQWNCWLMWGPSIPICRCSEWRGLYAFQYGYGDENNSVPVLEMKLDEHGEPPQLGEIAAHMRTEHRGARFTRLTGRLRWGSWFLEQAPEKASQPGLDIAGEDLDPAEHRATKHGAAPAQAALYRERSVEQRPSGGSVVLQLDRVDKSHEESRVYFSAYLWMMFLVAVRPRNPPAGEGTGPDLLRSKRYPDWPEREEQRARVREARLWEDLLPVFVHANIGDPDALAFQKQVLVQNAVELLRQVWERRGELFDAEDLEAGVQFYLVCASDYSGCGRELRFAPEHSLVALLRERISAEADRTFAAAVALPPPDETEKLRPWTLAGYFSACHLPELVADYYEHVVNVVKVD